MASRSRVPNRGGDDGLCVLENKGRDMKTIHEGDLIAKPGVIYDFKEITGYVYAESAAKDAFPKLTTVGGYVNAQGAAKDAFPALTTVGGYVNAPGAENIKQNDPAASALCRAALTDSLAKHGLSLHDGILSKHVSKRGPVSRVIVVGQTKVSYVVERDGVFAHGKTLALARADLLFKLGSRDTSIYKKWTLKTEKPLEEMIACYRAITGACGSGVEQFLAGKKYGKTITVDRVIQETAGQYGSEKFAGFFK